MATLDAANGLIYVAGGHSGPNLQYSGNIEKYIIACDTWIPLQVQLPFKHFLPGIIYEPDRNVLIAFGGEDSLKDYKKKTCVININTNEIQEFDNLPHERTTCVNQPVIVGKHLYAFLWQSMDNRRLCRMNLDTYQWVAVP